MSDLEQLRNDIDAIDDELIALLKKRIDVVGKVGALKREQGCKGLFIRPGREGQMHQRIYEAFKDSAYSPAAMLGIWRLLISASTHHESPMTLGILGAAETPEVLSLATSYFGDFLERRAYSNAGSLLSDLYEERISIGIMPFPQNEHAWWLQLAQYQSKDCFIFARLPIGKTKPQQPCALAVGPLTPEASGADESYFALQALETISTSRLHSLFQQAGLKAEFINAAIRPPYRSLLVKIDGFFTADDAALQTVQSQLDQASLVFLGAHPKALEFGA